MSDEDRRDSLADQAAAWVPPWNRPATPEPVPAPTAEPAPAPTPEPAPTAEDPGGKGPLEKPAAPSRSPRRGARRAVVQKSTATPGTAGTTGVAGAGPDGTGAARGADGAAGTPAVMAEEELRGALEAILLVVDEPVSVATLAQVLEQPVERVGGALERIAAGYTEAGHGFELRRAAGGWRLYTRPAYAPYVERFILDGQSVRLTQAALETLAVVAYKQPVTRSRISAIRGVNCDGVIRTLVSRGLVAECGTEPDSGAYLYRTTTLFLEKLGLDSVDDLPPLAPFLPDDVEEFADATR
ncbi:SMC-Scp complex subunit ScpB [Micromonospora cathayae]|uniref:SMC-Scp complex subunit ScpB n=1 Tax=Micromonospora cathayae TaxID=3028804 RepID=A0ABY7ZIZ3_9ACTN|nr:SMC-Scp complex subunit ScpB [Micromonospora sp. HUAS 3]WDZ82406.1 SMC-Scp complex subunit ScpB [Micromonospora sp. HUAS 3]